ncbi:MAG: FAD-binding protein [Helicobacteraceae bacterium]|jgi:L-aspartate oxidase|nr:FAD-binding protein [Helicobacteraceae bacterium]
MIKTEVLIIGSGAAGLTAAMFLPRGMKILIAAKKNALRCNTEFAQGGIAAPLDQSDIEAHIADTIKAGATRCDLASVRLLLSRALPLIEELFKLKMPFDLAADGKLARTREAAHSKARILHAGGDQTGAVLRDFLLKKARETHGENLTFIEGEVYDILIENDVALGAKIKVEKECKTLIANKTIIASGGIGSLYKESTNAPSVLGEIHGALFMRGAKLENMHFTQFHPTALISNFDQKPLLTEALRGEGAIVIDENKKQFLNDYDASELSPRDQVSRAIFNHQKKGHRTYLDLSVFDYDYFVKRFPSIFELLIKSGFKPPFEATPISPAFHYTMGGIAANLNSRVLSQKNSEIKNLYAIGEAACTGLHGANRLASNSLLEALVFAKVAAEDITNNFSAIAINEKFDENNNIKLFAESDQNNTQIIRETLWKYVGIIRTKEELKTAKDIFDRIAESDAGFFVKLRLKTAQIIVEHAIAEKTSVGAHYIES